MSLLMFWKEKSRDKDKNRRTSKCSPPPKNKKITMLACSWHNLTYTSRDQFPLSELFFEFLTLQLPLHLYSNCNNLISLEIKAQNWKSWDTSGMAHEAQALHPLRVQAQAIVSVLVSVNEEEKQQNELCMLTGYKSSSFPRLNTSFEAAISHHPLHTPTDYREDSF